MSAPFAIFRIAKLKTRGNLSGSHGHITRANPTPNADPKRTPQNVVLVGDRQKPILDAFDEAIAKHNINVRKNAVMGVEVVITASPEYFRPDDPARAGTWDAKKLSDWVEAQKQFIAQNFPHALYAELQLDEGTPHIQLIDLPLVEKNGKLKLDCRGKFGGDNRQGLALWQDKAGEAVAHLGIQRGIPGSKAKHTRVSQFYELANGPTKILPPVQPLPKPLPEPTLAERVPFTDAAAARADKEEAHDKAKKEAITHNQKRTQQAVKIVERVQAQAKAKAIAERKTKEAITTSEALSKELKKAQANEMRGLPLNEVVRRIYGGSLKPESNEGHTSKKYDAGGREVVLTTRDGKDLWFIQDEDKGGKGAIDFVIAFSGVDYVQAIKILVDEFGAEKTARAAAQATYRKTMENFQAMKKEPVAVPAHAPEKVPVVADYLQRVRKIPAQIVSQLFAAGRLLADAMGNAIFPRANGGAFKRGRGKFYQTIGGKNCGPYVLPGNASRVVFTESPIDALTLKTVEPDATIVATGGNLLGPAELAPYTKDKQVVLAFDTDKAGQQFTAAFKRAFVGAEVLTPPGGAKDWNEALQRGVEARKTIEQGQPLTESQTPPKTPAKGAFKPRGLG